MREDRYVMARTASGSTLRSKDTGISLDQARQKLLVVDAQRRNSGLANTVNSSLQDAQQK